MRRFARDGGFGGGGGEGGASRGDCEDQGDVAQFHFGKLLKVRMIEAANSATPY
jgi:hypothetical protein